MERELFGLLSCNCGEGNNGCEIALSCTQWDKVRVEGGGGGREEKEG